MLISRTVFRHNAFSTEITVKNFDIVHINLDRILKVLIFNNSVSNINKYVTWLRSIDKKISKMSNFATITTFSIPPSTRNPGIIPSDDPGQALSVSSKDIHLSKHAKISGIYRSGTL